MSREVCKHGVEVKYSDDRTGAWHPCNECVREEELRIAQFNAAFPGDRQKEFERKERRAEWIRNNVVEIAKLVADENGLKSPVVFIREGLDYAEMIADELIERGYL